MISEMVLVTLFNRLLEKHSYSPVSSLDTLVNINSTVTLVTFPSLVDIDTLVLDTLSLNDLLSFLHSTSGGGWPTPIHLNAVFVPSTTRFVCSSDGSRISAASVM